MIIVNKIYNMQKTAIVYCKISLIANFNQKLIAY